MGTGECASLAIRAVAVGCHGTDYKKVIKALSFMPLVSRLDAD
jgi:hypothetical protein